MSGPALLIPFPAAKNSMQRMGTSRSGQSRFLRQGRLAPDAEAHRWQFRYDKRGEDYGWLRGHPSVDVLADNC